ncbi:hypothetical protein JG687_00016976 [Phytophthora cactorum]|uniref:Uncharacterized protein n=1 Tax=Phytophthora cactorum TaxID=29920 RepID=A0A329RRD0_9STRA|nr:hypothetical protein Pcac1_g27867 [Phytophthora cactorum]KAG2800345.1 hypothetical protein PC112_g20525 [Phytophthora cactorum]KAG2800697.1 hypothetical protein PC111_g19868 [Phytophthora cactorum]KAG2834281.1 hypothetical protein PC113_g20422 [Phytophthora cactorum]KAG2878190.1 hypothetical protein PC114_g23250 [Phytophthora cactorum]
MLYETPMPGNESLALICNDDVIVAALNLVREAIVLLQNNGSRLSIKEGSWVLVMEVLIGNSRFRFF